METTERRPSRRTLSDALFLGVVALLSLATTCRKKEDPATSTTPASVVSFTLTASTAGPSGGKVTSDPAGIDCGSDCSESHVSGSTVSLKAVPPSGGAFVRWTGGGCDTANPCTVTVDADKTVTASFQDLPVLTVSKSGAGTGTVTSSPAGVSCGADCAVPFSSGTAVTLTAAPGSNSLFGGWSGGGCSGTGTCTVTVTTHTTVTASFTRTYTLTLTYTLNQAPSCTVTSSPAGISCQSDCTESYAEGTSVTLTREGLCDNSHTWGGACSAAAQNDPCTVTMDGDKTADVFMGNPS
jgi:hypothetical protein